MNFEIEWNCSYWGHATPFSQFRVLHVPNLSEELIVPIMQAADDLEIDSLRNLTCRKLADLTKNKSPEQIRGMLGIDDDFSEEEKREIRKELQLFWDWWSDGLLICCQWRRIWLVLGQNSSVHYSGNWKPESIPSNREENSKPEIWSI